MRALIILGLSCALALLLPGGQEPAWAQDASEAVTPEQAAAGAKLYNTHCAVCHGPKMVQQDGGYFDLRTFPKAQRSRFFNSVSNGKNSMPPWRSVLSRDEIGQLWAYVVTGEPK